MSDVNSQQENASDDQMQVDEVFSQGTQTNFSSYVQSTSVEAVVQRNPYSWGNIEELGLDLNTQSQNSETQKRSAWQQYRERRARKLQGETRKNSSKLDKTRRHRRCRRHRKTLKSLRNQIVRMRHQVRRMHKREKHLLKRLAAYEDS